MYALQDKMGDSVIVVSYHLDYNNDPMQAGNLAVELDAFRASKGWGTEMTSVITERKKYFPVPMRTGADDVGPYNQLKATGNATEDALAEIALTHTWNSIAKNVVGEITVTFSSQPQGADVRVGLFITEDSIIASQSNSLNWTQFYPSLYGKGNPILDFRHDNVLRAEILGNSYWGKTLTSGSVSVGTEYTVSFDYTVPATYGTMAPNLSKLSLVAFTCANNGEVYNAVKRKLVDDATAMNISAEHAPKFHTDASIRAVGNGEFLLDIYGDAVYTVKMYDTRGRVAAQKTRRFNTGRHTVCLTNNHKAAGLFIVALERTGQVICKERILTGK